MNFKLYLLVVCFVFLVSNCTEEDSANTTSDALITKVWKVDQVIINDQIDHTTDYVSSQWEFREDKTYTFTLAHGLGEAGTWQIVNNDTVLRLTKSVSGDDEDGVIVKLTENVFEWHTSLPNFKGVKTDLILRLIPMQ
jgi:hypothetical protein